MIITALVTPFNKRKNINYKKLTELLDFQKKSKVDGVLLFGTTGEGSTLTLSEKMKISLIATKKKYAPLKIILNGGSNNTKEAVKITRLLSLYKPYAILSITPYYNKTNSNGIIAHYKEIVKASKVPIIIYNVPSRTGYDIPIETIKELSKVDGIIGIKEASNNKDKIKRIRQVVSKSFLILSGNDDNYLNDIRNGANGIVSVLSNIIPNHFTNVLEIEKDWNIIEKYLPVMKLDINPIPIKTLMNLSGNDVGEFRLPLSNMDDNKLKKVELFIKEIRN